MEVFELSGKGVFWCETGFGFSWGFDLVWIVSWECRRRKRDGAMSTHRAARSWLTEICQLTSCMASSHSFQESAWGLMVGLGEWDLGPPTKRMKMERAVKRKSGRAVIAVVGFGWNSSS
ncbi:hypothetical protein Droror1_Dr00012290 [Drosera rotundifolia]